MQREESRALARQRVSYSVLNKKPVEREHRNHFRFVMQGKE